MGQSPRPSSPVEYSKFRIHFAPSDGHLPRCDHRARILCPHSPRSRPNLQSQPLPLSTPIILPALVVLNFKGVGEYLEDLLAWVNVPILDLVQITFLNQLIFSTSQLPWLIHLTKGLKKLKGALIVLCDHLIENTLFCKANVDAHRINLRISCTGPDWQLESVTQLCKSILPPLSSLRIIDDLLINHFGKTWRIPNGWSF